jgi:hypothetical protein
LLIYLVLLIGLVLIALVVGPVLVEQIRMFAAEVPGSYASIRSQLQTSPSATLHLIGQRLPPFEHLAQTLTEVAPQLYQGAVGVTTSVIKLFAYFLTVLVGRLYWTMEVPPGSSACSCRCWRSDGAPSAQHLARDRVQARRFSRGKGAMLSIGAASAISGTPDRTAERLALDAFSRVCVGTLIGPVLAVVPALLVALPLGLNTVLLVIGFTVVLQVIETNVLMPRIMHHAVGVIALIGILAVLAFGALYGVFGIVVAIPMTAVIQVLFESLVVNAEPELERQGLVGSPGSALRTRVRALRQQARRRLRARTSRMGIDPGTADHVVDAVDQQIEEVVARVERIMSVAEQNTEPMAAEERAAIVDKLHGATEGIEHAIERGDTIAATPEDSHETRRPTRWNSGLTERSDATGQVRQSAEPVEMVIAATADSPKPIRDGEPNAVVDHLDRGAPMA